MRPPEILPQTGVWRRLDRARAAGTAVRFEPGDEKTVRLVSVASRLAEEGQRRCVPRRCLQPVPGQHELHPPAVIVQGQDRPPLYVHVQVEPEQSAFQTLPAPS